MKFLVFCDAPSHFVLLIIFYIIIIIIIIIITIIIIIIIISTFITVSAGVRYVRQPGANHAPRASVTQVNLAQL